MLAALPYGKDRKKQSMKEKYKYETNYKQWKINRDCVRVYECVKQIWSKENSYDVCTCTVATGLLLMLETKSFAKQQISLSGTQGLFAGWRFIYTFDSFSRKKNVWNISIKFMTYSIENNREYIGDSQHSTAFTCFPFMKIY